MQEKDYDKLREAPLFWIGLKEKYPSQAGYPFCLFETV